MRLEVKFLASKNLDNGGGYRRADIEFDVNIDMWGNSYNSDVEKAAACVAAAMEAFKEEWAK